MPKGIGYAPRASKVKVPTASRPNSKNRKQYRAGGPTPNAMKTKGYR